jgi:hypothetical protein
VEKYCRARRASDDNIIRRMRVACCITKATHTYLEYLILTAFPRERWFRERALFLLYTYIAVLLFNNLVYLRNMAYVRPLLKYVNSCFGNVMSVLLATLGWNEIFCAYLFRFRITLTVFRRVHKIAKVTINVFMSVLSSSSLYLSASNNSASTRWIFMNFHI